jgi:hypothetical protein
MDTPALTAHIPADLRGERECDSDASTRADADDPPGSRRSVMAPLCVTAL